MTYIILGSSVLYHTNSFKLTRHVCIQVSNDERHNKKVESDILPWDKSSNLAKHFISLLLPALPMHVSDSLKR